jgi:hypothetical protein
MIKHSSGISSASVFWREEGDSNFTETAMTFVSDDNWTAILNVVSTHIEYYIWAQANSGKSVTRPIVAPEGYWTINVDLLSVNDWAQNHISAPYPNPTKDKVSFNFENIPGPISIAIYNLLGQKLYETEIENGNGIINLNLKSGWSGSLLVRFEGEFGSVNRKIIKL